MKNNSNSKKRLQVFSSHLLVNIRKRKPGKNVILFQFFLGHCNIKLITGYVSNSYIYLLISFVKLKERGDIGM